MTVSSTRLLRGRGPKFESNYALHPATIDGILHITLIATAAGVLKDFQLRLRVFLESFPFRTPGSYTKTGPIIIHGVAEPLGFNSMKTAVEVHNQQHGNMQQLLLAPRRAALLRK